MFASGVDDVSQGEQSMIDERVVATAAIASFCTCGSVVVYHSEMPWTSGLLAGLAMLNLIIAIRRGGERQ